MPWDSDSLLQQLELGEDSRVVAFIGNRVRAPHRDAIADVMLPSCSPRFDESTLSQRLREP